MISRMKRFLDEKGGHDLGERSPLSEQIDDALIPALKKDLRIVKVGHDLITIDGRRYRIVENYRDMTSYGFGAFIKTIAVVPAKISLSAH